MISVFQEQLVLQITVRMMKFLLTTMKNSCNCRKIWWLRGFLCGSGLKQLFELIPALGSRKNPELRPASNLRLPLPGDPIDSFPMLHQFFEKKKQKLPDFVAIVWIEVFKTSLRPVCGCRVACRNRKVLRKACERAGLPFQCSAVKSTSWANILLG